MTPDVPPLLFIDAHVHLHRCFDPAVFLEAAYTNFKGAAQRLQEGKRFIGVLLLTEGLQEIGFDGLLGLLKKQNATGDAGLGGWRLHHTKESTSLVLTFRDEKTLIVIAGRQVSSRENLEVLAIGTRQTFEDDLPIEVLICAVAQAGALPIVPWGFGKWMGSRGRRLKQLLQNAGAPPFFLGDNANRPALWPPSPLFRLAEERGLHNVPGSDPLPFPAECRHPGRFGCILQGSLDMAEPTRDLKEKLSNPSSALQPFGRRERLFRFVRNQAAMHYLMLTRRGIASVR